MRKSALLLTFVAMSFTMQAQTRLAGIKKLKFEFPGNFYRSSDTIHFSYTGTRNSDNGIIQYDTAMHYKIDSATASLVPFRRNTQTFDGANRITSNTLEIWNGTSWTNDSRVLLTYTGSQLTDSLYQGWVTGLWTDGQKWTYSYDGSMRDSMHYYYKNGSAWSEIIKAKYQYNSAMDIDTISFYKIDPFAGWQFSHYMLYNYSTGRLESIFNTSTEPNKYLFQYNGTGNVDTIIYQLPPQTGPTTLTNSKRYAFTYNADNKVLTSVSDTWFAGGWTSMEQIDSLTQYSYQSYGNTGIGQINNSTLKIYPNPVDHTLQLNISNPTNLLIIDISGRIYHKSHSTNIDCSKIPNGNYFLIVDEPNNYSTYQIVVSH